MEKEQVIELMHQAACVAFDLAQGLFYGNLEQTLRKRMPEADDTIINAMVKEFEGENVHNIEEHEKWCSEMDRINEFSL